MIDPEFDSDSFRYPMMEELLAPPENRLPEHNLLAAMLQRAIADASGSKLTGDPDESQLDARTFLHLYHDPDENEIERPGDFSFIWICGELGLDWRKFRDNVRVVIGIGLNEPPEPEIKHRVYADLFLV